MNGKIDLHLFSDTICNDLIYSCYDSEPGRMRASTQIPLIRAYDSIGDKKRILILGKASHGKSTALRVLEAELLYRGRICMLCECKKLRDIEKLYNKVLAAGVEVLVLDAYDELSPDFEEDFLIMIEKLGQANADLQIIVSSKVLTVSGFLSGNLSGENRTSKNQRDAFKDFEVVTILPFTFEQLDCVVDSSISRNSGYFRLLQTPMFLHMYVNLKEGKSRESREEYAKIDTEAKFIREYFYRTARKKTEQVIVEDYLRIGEYVFSQMVGEYPEASEKIPPYLNKIFYYETISLQGQNGRTEKRKHLHSINSKYLHFALAAYLEDQLIRVFRRRRPDMNEIVELFDELPDTDEAKEALYYTGQLMSENKNINSILQTLNAISADTVDYEKILAFYLGVSKDAACDVKDVFTFFRPHMMKYATDYSFVRSVIREITARSFTSLEFCKYGLPMLEKIEVENGIFRSENNCLIKKSDNGLWLGCNNSVIPDGVTYIRHHAFSHCFTLKEVVLPPSVYQVESLAFINCRSLEYVELGENVVQLNSNAFYDCSKIKSVVFKNKRMKFGTMYYDFRAFDRSKNIEHLTLPTSAIIYIPHLVGDTLKSLSVHQGEDVRGTLIPFSIADRGRLESLRSLHISKDVVDLTEDCFYNLRNRLESITVEEGNERYRSENNCLIKKNRKALVLGCKNTVFPPPSDVVQINPRAFAHVRELGEVDIGDHIEEIGESAFQDCVDLETFKTGSSLKRCRTFAFSDCTQISRIVVSDPQAWLGVRFDIFSANPMYKSAVLENEDGEIETLEIEKGTERISQFVLHNCKSIRKLVIPPELSEIGGAAFFKCANLEEVHISDLEAWCSMRFGSRSANPLHNFAKLFLNGNEVKELIIGKDIATLPKYAFIHAANIESVTFEGDTEVGELAFYGCPSLGRVIINSPGVRIAANSFDESNVEVIYYGTREEWERSTLGVPPKGISNVIFLRQ